MDVTKMTLEGYFLADYERLRNRVNELDEEVRKRSEEAREYGVFDLEQTCDAVSVAVASAYDIYGHAHEGITLEALRAADAMEDDDLMVWASGAYRSKDIWGPLQPISISYHKFQYTLKIAETRGTHVYVTDGRSDSKLLEIDFMEEEMCDNLGNWCRAEYLDSLKEAALECLHDNIKVAIEKMEQRNG